MNITLLTLSTTMGSFRDVDMSALVPASATGVMIRFWNSNSSNSYSLDFRTNGSTDDDYRPLAPNAHLTAFIKLDASKIWEVKRSNLALRAYLVGWTDDEAEYFVNKIVVNSIEATWDDVDISAHTTTQPTGVMVDVRSAATNFNIRQAGSTDTRIYFGGDKQGTHVTGVNASQVFQAYRGGAGAVMWLTGYFTKNTAFPVNEIDITPAITGSYQTLNLPAEALGMYVSIERSGAAADNIAYRQTGDAFDTPMRINRHVGGVSLGANQEASVLNATIKIYLKGYPIDPAIQLAKPDAPVWINNLLTWLATPNATEYKLTIYKNGLLLTQITTANLSYATGITTEGDYTATLQAIGDGTVYLDSEISELSLSYIITKLATPLKPIWTVNVLDWLAIPNATEYKVTVYKDSVLLVEVTTANLTYNTGVTDPATYTATIQAIGNGTTFIDSEISAVSDDYIIVPSGDSGITLILTTNSIDVTDVTEARVELTELTGGSITVGRYGD